MQPAGAGCAHRLCGAGSAYGQYMTIMICLWRCGSQMVWCPSPIQHPQHVSGRSRLACGSCWVCKVLSRTCWAADVSACAAGCLITALVAFPMPERFPRHYWLFHSLWHVFLSVGYYELYRMIEEETTVRQPAQVSLRLDCGGPPACCSLGASSAAAVPMAEPPVTSSCLLPTWPCNKALLQWTVVSTLCPVSCFRQAASLVQPCRSPGQPDSLPAGGATWEPTPAPQAVPVLQWTQTG